VITKFIHIGYPKTLSSVLQQSFFPKHKAIYYLGVGSTDSIDYIDDDISYIADNLLLYANERFYATCAKSALEHIDLHLKRAEELGFTAFGVSSEWFSLNLTPDMIDVNTRAERLRELFGEDTKVITFIRNQKGMIKSLYGQLVREGLPLTYSEFIDYIYNFRERNFCTDLYYDLTYQIYSNLFGKENVHFLPIENYRDENKQLLVREGKVNIIDDVCDILGVEYNSEINLDFVNASMSESELCYKLSLNKEFRHDFGNLMFEHANKHRNRVFLERNNLIDNGDPFSDVKKKRKLLEKAKKLSELMPKSMDYSASSSVLEELDNLFESSNRKLRKISGLNLPADYL